MTDTRRSALPPLARRVRWSRLIGQYGGDVQLIPAMVQVSTVNVKATLVRQDGFSAGGPPLSNSPGMMFWIRSSRRARPRLSHAAQ